MRKKIKLIVLLLILLLGFTTFLFIIYSQKDYETNYNVRGYKIIEKYDKNKSYYVFLIAKNNITYPYIIENKSFIKRDLITDIKIYNKENEECIMPISDKLKFYPLCSDGDNMYTHNLSNVETLYEYQKYQNVDTSFNDTKINFLNNLYFAIYDYQGFNLINTKDNKNIKLFQNDVYNLNLIYQMQDNLIIPDYNENHYFKKFNILNIKTGKLKEIKSDFSISFNSVFLGDYKNKIYLLDQKEEAEYEIDLKKEIIKKVDFKILQNNKWVKKTYKQIIKDNLNFLTQNKIDNTLYKKIENILVKISNLNVTKIIYNANDTIYYLSEMNLYMYNEIYGEVLLLSNFEWNFNNNNIIFLSE